MTKGVTYDQGNEWLDSIRLSGQMWLGLSKVDPGNNGQNIDESWGGTYTRVNIASDMGAASNLRMVNVNDIVFNAAPGAAWNDIEHLFIADLITSETRIHYVGRARPSVSVGASTQLVFRAGTIVIDLVQTT